MRHQRISKIFYKINSQNQDCFAVYSFYETFLVGDKENEERYSTNACNRKINATFEICIADALPKSMKPKGHRVVPDVPTHSSFYVSYPVEIKRIRRRQLDKH